MENNKIFTYSYSALQNKEVESIRKKYLPKEENKVETLRRLDRRAQSAGMVTSLTVGVIGCLIFGIGMCFGLDVFAGADWLSVLFCVIGAAVMLPAYPVYRLISRKVKARLTPEILRLSEELLGS
ncbi:MAG: hypothetical protein E7643_06345 [Ruminococcaceae bacterium]|nr:hypothetical protein [Oscillospiraceae bacterium]